MKLKNSTLFILSISISVLFISCTINIKGVDNNVDNNTDTNSNSNTNNSNNNNNNNNDNSITEIDPNIADNPSKNTYYLRTYADLDKIRKNPSAIFYVLNDIDFTGQDYQNNQIASFSGRLYGRGHTLSTIKQSYTTEPTKTTNLSFFSNTNGAYIEKLKFIIDYSFNKVSFSLNMAGIGGITGTDSNSTFSQVIVEGFIRSQAVLRTGGFIAFTTDNSTTHIINSISRVNFSQMYENQNTASGFIGIIGDPTSVHIENSFSWCKGISSTFIKGGSGSAYGGGGLVGLSSGVSIVKVTDSFWNKFNSSYKVTGVDSGKYSFIGTVEGKASIPSALEEPVKSWDIFNIWYARYGELKLRWEK